ncbi:MAG: hypothetical protein KC486_30435 [Myxococcales bacterium]|nr:hypothetical protein [Myxococcales bacterium]
MPHRPPPLPRALAFALSLAAAACTGDDTGATASGSDSGSVSASSTSGATSTSASAGASTAAATGSTTADISGSDATSEATTSTSTGDTSTTGVIPEWCNLSDAPCPEGMKCILDGGQSKTQCVDLVADPKQFGDACDGASDPFDDVDDCDDGLICFGSEEGGICIPFCGIGEDFSCPSGYLCSTCQDCVLGLCIPSCDPVGDDCSPGQVCIPEDNGFVCVVDASAREGAFGDPCEFVNACDPGLVCLNPDYVPDCDSAGCCTPFCDLGDPQCPDLPDLECIAWFEEGQAPADLEHVGVCAIPPP